MEIVLNTLYGTWLVFANLAALAGILTLEYSVLEGVMSVKDWFVSKTKR